MDITVLLGLVAFANLVSYGEAVRECYLCDSSSGFSSAKACKGDSPDKRELNRIKVAEVEEECIRCFKRILSDGHVSRGCLAQKDWKHIESYYDGGTGCTDQITEGEKKVNTYCVCDTNRCNSGSFLAASLMSNVLVLIAKLVL